jgi:hypothetical protein
MPREKTAGGPTWNASPTETLSTETLSTRSAGVDAASSPLLLDLRAGIDENLQGQGNDLAAELLQAVARMAPASARYELLVDPEQATGRAALRRRLITLSDVMGFDAAVVVVAGEWPVAVTSAMAHANARARARLDGHPVSSDPVSNAPAVRHRSAPAPPAPVPPTVETAAAPTRATNPLAGLAEARQALAEAVRP